MSQTMTIAIYKFDELSENAKEKAREWWREGGTSYEWWDCQCQQPPTKLGGL